MLTTVSLNHVSTAGHVKMVPIPIIVIAWIDTLAKTVKQVGVAVQLLHKLSA